MIDIFYIFYFSAKTADIARAKGYSGGGVRALAIVLWFTSEIVGVFIGLALLEPSYYTSDGFDKGAIYGAAVIGLILAITVAVLLYFGVKSLAPKASAWGSYGSPQPAYGSAWYGAPQAWQGQSQNGMAPGAGWPAGQGQAAWAAAPPLAPAAPAIAPDVTVPVRIGRVNVVESGHQSTFSVNPGGQLVVGRGRESNILLSDPLVSRQHALIAWNGTGWTVRDLGATNPTRLLSPSGSARPVSGETTIPSGQLLMGEVLLTLCPAQ